MYKLDEFQDMAVHSNSKNSLIIASPGSGKTTVIINRIVHLIKNSGIDFKNIIIITFTKAAALDMERRYISLIENNDNIPFFGTFHSLFYHILKNYYGKVNIIDSEMAYKIIENTLKNYCYEVNKEKVIDIIKDISCFKRNGGKTDEFNEDKIIFENCMSEYEQYKDKNNLIDFDDMQLKCLEIFKSDKKILNKYINKWNYILVDEFQDCDYIQVEILKMIINENNSIFAVGDEDQCIYAWRGAKPDYMVRFKEDFKFAKKYYLIMNYRNPPNIVNMSLNLIKHNKLRNNKNITSYKNKNKKISIINCTNEVKQADKIINIIEDSLKSSFYKYGDNAVLYRTNNESKSLIDSFISKKIPFKLLDTNYNFYNHLICRDIIAYFKLSINFNDKDSFLRIINKPYRYISKNNLYKIKENLMECDYFEFLNSFENVPYYLKRKINILKKNISKLKKLLPKDSLDFIINNLNYYDYLKEYCIKYKMCLLDFDNIIFQLKESVNGFKNIKDFLSHIQKIEEGLIKSKKDISNHDCVTLSTIHGVKGMEFKNVYIINCNERIIPHKSSTDDNLEEERRLFYVAITRTIDNLYIFHTQNVRGECMEASRFIKESNINFQEVIYNLKIGDVVLHKVYGKGKIIEKGSDYLSIKFDNGVLNSFNTNILINNDLLAY